MADLPGPTQSAKRIKKSLEAWLKSDKKLGKMIEIESVPKTINNIAAMIGWKKKLVLRSMKNSEEHMFQIVFSGIDMNDVNTCYQNVSKTRENRIRKTSAALQSFLSCLVGYELAWTSLLAKGLHNNNNNNNNNNNTNNNKNNNNNRNNNRNNNKNNNNNNNVGTHWIACHSDPNVVTATPKCIICQRPV